MPAEVDKMFSVRAVPWHLEAGITTTDEVAVLAEYPGREEAMKLAGHDFTVVEEPTFRRVERPCAGCGGEGVQGKLGRDPQTCVVCNGKKTTVAFVEMDGYKALFNDQETEKKRALHVAKDSYVVVQPGVLYDLTEAILDQQETVRWETGGTLSNGEVLWTLAKVDEPFQITGDDSPIYPYVVASTTNNGTGGVKVANIQMRIVCRNTFNAADYESANSGREFTFRHTRNVNARLEEAKAILAGAKSQAKSFVTLGEDMVKVPFTDKAIDAFCERMVGAKPGEVVSDRVKANIERDRAALRGLFDGKTVNENIRNTGYGAMQVGIEYLQYLRKGRGGSEPKGDTYVTRTLLKPEPLADKLVPLIRKVADENPVSVLA